MSRLYGVCLCNARSALVTYYRVSTNGRQQPRPRLRKSSVIFHFLLGAVVFFFFNEKYEYDDIF